jgi:hypothetical protein
MLLKYKHAIVDLLADYNNRLNMSEQNLLWATEEILYDINPQWRQSYEEWQREIEKREMDIEPEI